MKFSAGVVLTLLVSPASAFVQRPSLVFQAHPRTTFRQDVQRGSRHPSTTLQVGGIVDAFTAIAADPGVTTAVGSSLSLLDVAVFLVPLSALAAGATAISQRDLIRSEIDTTERTLAETKSLLEKSDQTIKVRSEEVAVLRDDIAAALIFIFFSLFFLSLDIVCHRRRHFCFGIRV